MVQLPLAAVLPVTPAIVTRSPLLRPAVLGTVMTMGDALLAPVIVPLMFVAPLMLLLAGFVGMSGPALQRFVVGL